MNKENLNRYCKVEMIYCILLDYNRIKLEINSKRKHWAYINSDGWAGQYWMGHWKNEAIEWNFEKWTEIKNMAHQNIWIQW